MQQNFNNFTEKELQYCVGDDAICKKMVTLPAFVPFDEEIIKFLNALSQKLLKNIKAKLFPEVITFAFWCRKASIENQKKKYEGQLENRLGRGLIFHIAPSNVPVNFAYSMVAGLLAGNANLVRLPSKDFEQVEIITESIQQVLEIEAYQSLKPYFVCVRYGHNEAITAYFSSLCDTRVIWGGDHTIEVIRKAPLKPRATEITFADRYSIAMIDADRYLEAKNKQTIAQDFYNDTYLTDQNACTAPRIVIWLGQAIEQAKDVFWDVLYEKVQQEYEIQAVQAISKQHTLLKLAATHTHVQKVQTEDNRIVRVKVETLTKDLMAYRNNSGYFMEYDAKTMDAIEPLCQSECQTLSYYGVDLKKLKAFIFTTRPKGIDRIVPMGKTMDFELVWDGMDLIERMTRNMVII
ncbi:MAG: acyl-CoA reductase [Eubacterium sp.]